VKHNPIATTGNVIVQLVHKAIVEDWKKTASGSCVGIDCKRPECLEMPVGPMHLRTIAWMKKVLTLCFTLDRGQCCANASTPG